jgi:hypothetical protein
VITSRNCIEWEIYYISTNAELQSKWADVPESASLAQLNTQQYYLTSRFLDVMWSDQLQV